MPYKNHLRMTDLLGVLDARYGQREQREEAAQSQLSALREDARSRGLVAEADIAQALQAYTRTELLASARLLDGEGCKYVPGAGLFSEAALKTTHDALQVALEPAPNHKITLEEAASVINASLPAAVDLEALIQVWPEFTVERPSLFEAYVVKREELLWPSSSAEIQMGALQTPRNSLHLN